MELLTKRSIHVPEARRTSVRKSFPGGTELISEGTVRIIIRPEGLIAAERWFECRRIEPVRSILTAWHIRRIANQVASGGNLIGWAYDTHGNPSSQIEVRGELPSPNQVVQYAWLIQERLAFAERQCVRPGNIKRLRDIECTDGLIHFLIGVLVQPASFIAKAAGTCLAADITRSCDSNGVDEVRA